MKLCTTCGKVKELSEFNKNEAKPDGVGSKCRECMKTYRKQYYEDNKEMVITKVRKRKAGIRIELDMELRTYLSSHPCVDCGISDPRILEFDHRDRETKAFTIGRKINSDWTWDKLLVEIEKCDVRCKNCHAIRTQVQMNHLRSQWLPIAGL